MTAIHRSGSCDKRDKESRRGCRMEPFRSLPLREHRRQQGNERKPLRSEGEGRQCATMSPDIRIAAPNCYLIERKRRFTVNLSGARPRHWKSEVLSMIGEFWRRPRGGRGKSRVALCECFTRCTSCMRDVGLTKPELH